MRVVRATKEWAAACEKSGGGKLGFPNYPKLQVKVGDTFEVRDVEDNVLTHVRAEAPLRRIVVGYELWSVVCLNKD